MALPFAKQCTDGIGDDVMQGCHNARLIANMVKAAIACVAVPRVCHEGGLLEINESRGIGAEGIGY